MKRQPNKWEKILAHDKTEKELIFKVYLQLVQLNIKKKNQKMGRRPEQTFFQGRYTDGQQAHEMMLNIANHQSNVNQNQNEISPHTCQNGYHQKIYK